MRIAQLGAVVIAAACAGCSHVTAPVPGGVDFQSVPWPAGTPPVDVTGGVQSVVVRGVIAAGACEYDIAGTAQRNERSLTLSVTATPSLRQCFRHDTASAYVATANGLPAGTWDVVVMQRVVPGASAVYLHQSATAR